MNTDCRLGRQPETGDQTPAPTASLPTLSCLACPRGAATVWRDGTPLFPVLQSKCRDSREFTSIVRHQCQVVPKRDGGDLKVVRPDRLAPALERAADFGALHRARVIEGTGRER